MARMIATGVVTVLFAFAGCSSRFGEPPKSHVHVVAKVVALHVIDGIEPVFLALNANQPFRPKMKREGACAVDTDGNCVVSLSPAIAANRAGPERFLAAMSNKAVVESLPKGARYAASPAEAQREMLWLTSLLAALYGDVLSVAGDMGAVALMAPLAAARYSANPEQATLDQISVRSFQRTEGFLYFPAAEYSAIRLKVSDWATGERVELQVPWRAVRSLTPGGSQKSPGVAPKEP